MQDCAWKFVRSSYIGWVMSGRKYLEIWEMTHHRTGDLLREFKIWLESRIAYSNFIWTGIWFSAGFLPVINFANQSCEKKWIGWRSIVHHSPPFFRRWIDGAALSITLPHPFRGRPHPTSVTITAVEVVIVSPRAITHSRHGSLEGSRNHKKKGEQVRWC